MTRQVSAPDASRVTDSSGVTLTGTNEMRENRAVSVLDCDREKTPGPTRRSPAQSPVAAISPAFVQTPVDWQYASVRRPWRRVSRSGTCAPAANASGTCVAFTAPPCCARTANVTPLRRTASETPGQIAFVSEVRATSAAAPSCGTVQVACRTKSSVPVGSVSVSISSPSYMKPRPTPVSSKTRAVAS